MPDISKFEPCELFEVLMEFDCLCRASLMVLVRELDLQIFDLALSAKRVVQKLDIDGAVSSDISHFKLL